MSDAAAGEEHEAQKTSRRGGRRVGAGRPRRAETDGAVLDVTVELLTQVGYAGLRVDDVAQRTGIAKSTIYRRWPSKPAMVAAAVQRLYLEHVEVPDTGSLQADLVALLSNSYQVLVVGRGRVFTRLVRESGHSPELVEVIVRTMHARRRFYRTVFNRAMARGEIAPETDVGLTIDLLLGPLWVPLLVTGEPIGTHVVETTVDSVLQGILAPGASRRGQG